MAITIKQQPEELSASGNRMYFLVHTDRTNTINYKMTAQIQLIESANKVVELPFLTSSLQKPLFYNYLINRIL